MKKIFSFIVLGSFALLSADQNGGNHNNSESMSTKAYHDESDHEQDAKSTEDRELSKHIYDKLYGYVSSGTQNVVFELNGGVVTLNGSVNSKEEKDKIEKDLKDVSGVKRIVNNIKVVDAKKVAYYQPNTADSGAAVKNGAKTSKDYAALDNDKKINAIIRDKLDNKGFGEVSIITANGVVTLGGFVNKEDEFVPLVLEIEKIEGVKKVNSKVSQKK